MKILIIGIGNPGRGDDGLGPALVARLAGAGAGELAEGVVVEIPGGPSAVWKYQLNIEDANLIKDFDVVVFSDASTEGAAPVSLAEIAPAAAIVFTTHEMSPSAVLALGEELYGRTPRGYLLAMRGYSWELADGLSAAAAENIETALGRFREFMNSAPR